MGGAVPRAAVRQAARVTAGAGVGRLGRRLAAGGVTVQGARAKAGTLRGRVRLPVGPRRLPRGFQPIAAGRRHTSKRQGVARGRFRATTRKVGQVSDWSQRRNLAVRSMRPGSNSAAEGLRHKRLGVIREKWPHGEAASSYEFITQICQGPFL